MKIAKTPRSIDLLITNRCNLHCKYCSYFTSTSDSKNELSTGEWLAFFDELKQCSVMDTIIQGGEPFCREDLKELIEGIVRNRMRFSILTNGILITDGMAKFLASTGRCNGIQVSIDGSFPAPHDSMRGEGSFLKAVEGLRILQKHSLPVNSRVTIHRENVRDLENIARLLLEELKLPGFSSNYACYMGLCRRNSKVVELNVEERSFAMEVLLKLNMKYKGRLYATAGPLYDAKYWTMMERVRREGRKPPPSLGHLVGCGGIDFRLSVRSDGVIVPCCQVSHIELGRINEDSLKEIWQNHPTLNRLRQRHNIPLSDFEFCRGCPYINYCTGNCPALAYTVFGNEYHPSPDGCLWHFLKAGGRLPDDNLLFASTCKN